MTIRHKSLEVMMNVPPIDLTNTEFIANPYPYYHMLRETAPLFWFPHSGPSGGMWLATRYDDVATALKAPFWSRTSHAWRRRKRRRVGDAHHQGPAQQRPTRPHPTAQPGQPGLHAQAHPRPGAASGGYRLHAAGRGARAAQDELHGRLRRALPYHRHRRAARRAGGRPS